MAISWERTIIDKQVHEGDYENDIIIFVADQNGWWLSLLIHTEVLPLDSSSISKVSWPIDMATTTTPHLIISSAPFQTNWLITLA